METISPKIRPGSILDTLPNSGSAEATPSTKNRILANSRKSEISHSNAIIHASRSAVNDGGPGGISNLTEQKNVPECAEPLISFLGTGYLLGRHGRRPSLLSNASCRDNLWIPDEGSFAASNRRVRSVYAETQVNTHKAGDSFVCFVYVDVVFCLC